MSEFWISVYDIEASGASPVAVPGPASRFFYVCDGEALIRSSGAEVRVGSDNGTFTTGDVTVEGMGTVWMFELSSGPAAFTQGPLVSLVRSQRLESGIRGERILRADRIESPPGAATPLHRHRGPGIRRLVRGRLMAQVGDHIERIDSGDSWFESGHDPVIGTNINDANNVFVRVMVLPPELSGGKTSFVPPTTEDAAKPRAVAQRLFGEMPVLLG
jgi:hypothetical protein